MAQKSGIGYDATEYAKSKQFPFRTEVERYTIFNLLGNPQGLRILDAGCGEGIYSRQLIDLGARHVLGIDADSGFIQKARESNNGYDGKIDYQRAFIQDTKGNQDLDIAIGSYVLSYPRNFGQAVSYLEAIASHLKKGARFIGFNNNPFQTFNGIMDYSKYGFTKEMSGDKEGSPVFYHIEGMSDPITNFHLNPTTYEKAFTEAGFLFEWEEIMLNSSEVGKPYWEDFFKDEPPFIAMTATKI